MNFAPMTFEVDVKRLCPDARKPRLSTLVTSTHARTLRFGNRLQLWSQGALISDTKTMARKSNQAAGAAVSKNLSKRRTPPEPATTTLSKRPKRQSTSNPAPSKSDYFSHESSRDEKEDDHSAAESSGFEASEVSSPSNEDEEIESENSDEEDVKSSKRSRASAASRSKQVNKGSKGSTSSKSELWRPGVSTGLESGTQVVIKKPKARDPGKVPYTENTIHPNTMLFLQDLAANNDRGWLKSELFICLCTTFTITLHFHSGAFFTEE